MLKINKQKLLDWLAKLAIGACTACIPVMLAALWSVIKAIETVPHLSEQMTLMHDMQYTRADAQKDMTALNDRLIRLDHHNEQQDAKIESIDRRVLIIETHELSGGPGGQKARK